MKFCAVTCYNPFVLCVLHVCFGFGPPSWISWGPPYSSKMADDFGMAAGRHVPLLASQIFQNIA